VLCAHAQVKFLNSVIVELKRKNTALQEQLDTLMLSPDDDAALYDFDVNGELRFVDICCTNEAALLRK